MPLNIDVTQILLHMLNFIILAGGLTLLLYKPVNKFLCDRAEHFAELEKKNKEERESADALKKEYEEKLTQANIEADSIRTDAQHEMANISRTYLAEAKEKADLIIKSAEKEAEARKEHILDSAQTEIGELVITAAQKMLNDTVTPERNSHLYDEFIRMTDSAVADKRKNK